MKKEVWKKVVAGAGIILALGVGAGCAKEKKEGTGKVRIVGTSNQSQLQQK
jgi:hypothetical protein